MQQQKENLRIQQWVVAVALSLFCLKALALYLTHSVAVLTDALESTVNVIAGLIGWYSLHIASKPKDADHPYGHGKAEPLAAALAAVFFFCSATHASYLSCSTASTTMGMKPCSLPHSSAHWPR